ncbi:polysaccharide deacetylase family protein [Thermodesulfobacteriota bacterium]
MGNERIETKGTADTTGVLDKMLDRLPFKESGMDGFKYPEGIRLAVNFTIDFDAMLARKLMQDPALSVTKGEFGGRVGIWRLMDLFDKHDIKATIFTPGRICELYPDALKEATARGHELADHTWEHHVPNDPELEKDHLHKTTDALYRASGKKPVGSRSRYRINFLKEKNYIYTSMISADELPAYVTDGERNHMLNLPFTYALDDAMYFSFRIFGSSLAGQRLESPDKVYDIWLSIFKRFYKTEKYMNICLHPFVSGRSLRIAMIDRLILEMKKMPGVWFPTCEEMARYCIDRFPPADRPK